MDISEKILKFAENQNIIDEKLHGDFSEQYQNGYNVGYTEGKTDGYNDGYDNGMVDGAASVPNPLEYARGLNKLYAATIFPDNYELKIDVPIAVDMSAMFYSSRGITKLTLIGNNNGRTLSFEDFIRNCSSIVEVDLTNFIVKPSSIQGMCNNSRRLKAIKGVFDLTECTKTTQPFVACVALEEIRFKENSIKLSINFSYSKKLSSETVQSIIDGLATVETTQTLNLDDTLVSALTDDQVLQITNKNWSVV